MPRAEPGAYGCPRKVSPWLAEKIDRAPSRLAGVSGWVLVPHKVVGEGQIRH